MTHPKFPFVLTLSLISDIINSKGCLMRVKNRISYGETNDRALRCWIELVRGFTKIRAKELPFIESFDITIQQFGVMEVLYHLGGLRISEIIRLTLSSSGNMTVVIKNLKKKGLVETEQEPKDKRVTLVSLTPKGVDLISGMFEEHAKQITEFISPLDKTEQETLTLLLRKLEKAH